LHNLTQMNTNIVKENYNLQNSNICLKFYHYNHIKKKLYKIFCVANNCDSDLKNDVSY